MPTLTQMTLPEFGHETQRPEIPLPVYQARLRATVERMREEALDVLIIYGDREHAANLAYLTGFDPRFEEALLLLDRDGRRWLLVGNECLGYLPDPALGCEVVLFQEFSLLGQPRGSSRPLREICGDFGIRPGTRVGCVGWKYYSPQLVDGGPYASDLPGYLIDLFRELAGGREQVVNATALFMHPEHGLRVINEPEQIAWYEYAATVTSDAMLALLRQMQVGVEEQALARCLDNQGIPLSCHPMVSFGEKARRGLASPSQRVAVLGDPFTVAFGVAGALTCRAGCVAHGPEDLPAAERDFYADFAANYFAVVATWYAQLGIGGTGGAVFQAVEACRRPDLYRFAVNPGHLLHLDEWVHSPFAAGDTQQLRSGMALQADIIPVSHGLFYYINAEDGVVLADAALRQILAARYPACWRRMQARRDFMRTLGIPLDDAVLPLSNIPAWLPPYALSPDWVLVNR